MNRFHLFRWVIGILLVYASGVFSVHSQTVTFPQKIQPGKALLKQKGRQYALQNKLFQAKFTQTAEGKLIFGGCPEMNLLPDTELFKLVLPDSIVLYASDFQLVQVSNEDLPADLHAVKGVLRFPGKALSAVFTHQHLTVRWRAVLRDGSHYLRTEMEISATHEQPMHAVTAMMYAVDEDAAAPAYHGNMTVEQCTDVVRHWHDSFFVPYKKAPVAFVWDDGWDEYGTWKFNPNFPHGFQEVDQAARPMQAGIGAWLGPVGGYGKSGKFRRAYWADKGGMQLSNQSYYDFFVKACTDMIDRYDFRFFKFDGISAQFSAVGPDEGDTGRENAEAIISIERDVRKKKADIFINTTVGTWASPFWFQFTDAIWRQEADWEVCGVGDDRERWITYRDRLVYQNFVQRSPLCPINTLMTHGFILTRFGKVSKTMDYEGIRRELRCAFACGSGMVELYNDYQLMDSIQGGQLWKDLADCMDWQTRHADVLADVHWVGGNPWTGEEAQIYGWAAWNGQKATLSLRNPDVKPQVLHTTLRKALDIPDYIQGKMVWQHSFPDQTGLTGLPIHQPVELDTPLTLHLSASSVYVLEGMHD